MFLYGKNSIIERLKVNPKSIKEIRLQDNFKDQDVILQIKKNNIPARFVTVKDLEKIKRADRLQGIVAKVDDFKYTPFENILKEKLTIIAIDSLNDPHNLGSIIRIAACFGKLAVVIPEHGSCEANETVIHVASGGENYVKIACVGNMTQFFLKAKEQGYWIAGTVVEGGESLYKFSFPSPLCLVLGSEGEGIRPGLKNHLDFKITLPMQGANLSFNVAMACAIFSYEIERQKLK